MEPYRRSVPYLRTAERNRLAKMRFLNATATADQVPVVKAAAPAAADCADSSNAAQWPPNPFTAFLESMDQLRNGQPTDRHADRLMEVLATLEQQATANQQQQQSDNSSGPPPPPQTTNGASGSGFKRDFGYRHAGTFNGRSMLRVWPSVRRSLSRRSSVDSLRCEGYASDGGDTAAGAGRQLVRPLAVGK